MGISNFVSRSLSTARVAFASSMCLLPSTQAFAYKHIDPKAFVHTEMPQILRRLGASSTLLKVNEVATQHMIDIIASEMVQRMAKGTLSKEEWDKKYMKADARYISDLGFALSKRVKNEAEAERAHLSDLADMFSGYGKHFERLKKYGLSPQDVLVSPECDQHIELLSKKTTLDECYVGLLTDMIPYVVFAKYLRDSIDENDDNDWKEYAEKYGNLDNKYAKEKLGKTIQIANEILLRQKVDIHTAENLFGEGFSFEEWFIRKAFSQEGFTIKPATDIAVVQ